MILLACSVLLGIGLAHNRLQSYRITTRTARLRQLRDRLVGEQRSYERTRLAKQASFFAEWAKNPISKKEEKADIYTAARVLEEVIPESYKREAKEGVASRNGQGQIETDVPSIADATTKLIETLRAWSDKADDRSWRLLKFQTWSFIIGASLLLIVPLIYYS
jgi:hypothetical protein